LRTGVFDMRSSYIFVLLTMGSAVFLLLLPSGHAVAHEHRRVGAYELTVGWVDEPVYVGFKNGVVLLLKHAGKPVTDLGDGLKVEIILGTQKLGPLLLDPAFGKSSGTPGEYRDHTHSHAPGHLYVSLRWVSR
jgi:hypothetical protein